VPKGIAWQWAATFGLRPTSELLRTLLASHRLWAVVQRFGMVACPHGFCIAEASSVPVGPRGCGPGPVRAAVCNIPDSAEACSCRVKSRSGDGYCYLDGYAPEERAVAERLLGRSPTAAAILRLTPEYDASAYWEGGKDAHVSKSAPYRLVDLPAEVIVGGSMATCKALGSGHFLSEYCQACRTMPGGVPRFQPASAGCKASAGHPGEEISSESAMSQLRADKKVMSKHEGEADALWVREKCFWCSCAPRLEGGMIGLVALCTCSQVGDDGIVQVPIDKSLSGLVEGMAKLRENAEVGLPGEPCGTAGQSWKRLSVHTPTSWTTLLHKGEEMRFSYGGKLVAQERPVVVHMENAGTCVVKTSRRFFVVRTHNAMSAKRMLHMRFAIGGFTHWKILEKLNPSYVWRQKSGLCVEEDTGIVPSGQESDGLCSSYYLQGVPGIPRAVAGLVPVRHGHGLIVGTTPVFIGALCVAPGSSAWIYPGDGTQGYTMVAYGDGLNPDPGKRSRICVMDDDYELDDGGPSSGEEGYSAGDAYV